jgi:membrane protein implicated in regulation of membrane protease activity
MDGWLVLWIILAALFAVTEILTMAFVAIFFSIGAVAGALVAWLGGDAPWQLLAFGATGLVLLAITRPVIKRRFESPNIPTNVNRMVGRTGIVTIPIDNDASTGQIRVGTEFWTARWPEDAQAHVIPIDARVGIVAVEGVTARVLPRDSDA